MAENWTGSQKEAWSYARSAAGQETTATGALREYRAGGGSIRSQDWYSVYRTAEESIYVGKFAEKLPDSYTIPANLVPLVDVRYQERYQAHVTVSTMDAQGRIYHDVSRIVQSNKSLTMGEWKQAITDSIQADRSIPSLIEVEITDIQFTERM